MFKYTTLVLILICISFIVFTLVSYAYERQKTETFQSQNSIWQPHPLLLSSTNDESCRAIPLKQSSCSVYDASNHDTEFDNNVWITDGIYLCDNLLESKCNVKSNPEQFELLQNSVKPLYEIGFALDVSDKIITQNTIDANKKKLKTSHDDLQKAYNNAFNSKKEFQTKLQNVFTKHCFASPYYTQGLDDNTCPATLENSSMQTNICNNLCKLMGGIPPQPETPFSLTAMPSEELQMKFPYSFIEVVPYTELGKEDNNRVFTDIEFVFEYAPNSNTVHPSFYIPEMTYFIRIPSQYSQTNEKDTQLILHANQEITVIIEMWMPNRVNAFNWLTNQSNRWERIQNYELAHFNATRYGEQYTVDYLTDKLNWFKGGAYFKTFKKGSIIHLRGNGGNPGEGAYHVFVTHAPFSKSHIHGVKLNN